jgi:hypothetical protein
MMPARARTLIFRTDGRLRGGSRPAKVAGIAAVIVLLMVTSTATRYGGGAMSPFNHLGYFPILMAAYLFGLRGGLITALVVSSFLGPLPWRLGDDASEPENLVVGSVRAAVYIATGALTGYLFDHGRLAVAGWRTAAIETARREKDGMVALARGAEAKDTDTGDHVVRVQLLAEHLALATGIDQERATDIGWAAMLHDVGKLHVPDVILLKPAALNESEWAVMKMHPIWGEHILEHGQGFEMARRIARWHHENIDGTGYPDGLKGGQIPIEARIVRIADSFDAMTHNRPYKPGRAVSWALAEIERYAGSQFDPELARLMIELLQSRPNLLAESIAARAAGIYAHIADRGTMPATADGARGIAS